MKDVKLRVSSNGRIYKYPATLDVKGGRIWFVKSAFPLKDEIKSMQGSRWHGFDEPPQKIWSVLDCERNRFQLDYLQGGDPYAWWDRPVEPLEFERELRTHQVLMVEHIMTYHYGILAAEMGLGKTLAAIEIIERSGYDDWWWIGPKSALEAVKQEFKKWGLKIPLNLLTYQGLVKTMKEWEPGKPAPRGVIVDESSRCKGATSQRTKATQALVDAIRAEHGKAGFGVLLTGTPSPKSPLDWWAQCEIAWPGFLREGSRSALEKRLTLQKKQPKRDGYYFERVTFWDDENKCVNCGLRPFDDEPCRCSDYRASFNEVAYLDKRLEGLALPFLKKDWLDLPDKQYREVILPPSRTIERVAESLAEIAPTPIQALTWLRELSDGFQYTEKVVGEKPCPDCCGAPDDECDRCDGEGVVPDVQRDTKMIPCPKDDAIKDLLDENEEQGRLIIFAGFQGSIDRVRQLCLDQKWDVAQVDGRGWKVFSEATTELGALEYWQSDAKRVVFLAHPQSGGMGLTLTEARMAVYYSNDFNPESRAQSEDRGHRMGMDINKGFTIVDLYHLPTDKHVREVLKDNRRLELMTMGEVQEALK